MKATFMTQTGIPVLQGREDVNWIGSSGAQRKYLIVHELGHALLDLANGLDGASINCSANLDGCTPGESASSHTMATKEYQSCAAHEGAASFYAAVAFNADVNETDCEYEKSGVDWDRNGSYQVTDDPDVFSCESGIVLPNDPDIDGGDFLGDYCLGSGYTLNRGTQYDWLRALWDFRTGQGVPFPKILDMWDLANPDDWLSIGNGTGTSYPITRIRNAADDASIDKLSEWDNVDDYNGVHR